MLRLKLFKIVVFYPTRLGIIYTIFEYKFSELTLKETVILWSQMYVASQHRISLRLFILALVIYLLLR